MNSELFVGPMTAPQIEMLRQLQYLFKTHGQNVAIEKDTRLKPVYAAIEKAEELAKLNGARFEKGAKDVFLEYVKDLYLQQIVLSEPTEAWEVPSEATLDDHIGLLTSPGKDAQSAFPFG